MMSTNPSEIIGEGLSRQAQSSFGIQSKQDEIAGDDASRRWPAGLFGFDLDGSETTHQAQQNLAD